MKYLLIFFSCLTISFSAVILYLKFSSLLFSPTTSTPSISPTTTPTPSLSTSKFSYDLAPSDTLIGQVLTSIGQVDWLSRTASQSASFTLPKSLQQGESLTSGLTGKFSFSFPEAATVSAGISTRINIIQTLPVNLVLEQAYGTADYQTGDTIPLSIRAKNLLTNVSPFGRFTLTVDENNYLLTGRIISGSVTLAYNNLQYVSQVKTISSGKYFLFNYKTTRLVVR